MEIKLNIVNQEYKFRIRNNETKIEQDITILAESEESAKLKLPVGFEIVKEIKTESDIYRSIQPHAFN